MPVKGPNEIFEVLSPIGPVGVEILPPAPRPETLDGRTIAFVWDHVFRGDEMFPVIERSLQQQFEGIRFIPHQTFGSIFGGDEEAVLDGLPEKLREMGVDGAICGVGC